MKQKQVKAAPKNAKQTNLKKATPPKKVAAPVAEEEDEEQEEVVAVKKPGNKKAALVQKKATPAKKVAAPVEEEEEEEEVVEKKVVAAKKPANKKAAPVQKKVVQVVEEPEEEEDDEEEDEENDEVEEEVEADEDQEDEEMEEEDGDEQDDDDEAEDDDEAAEEEQDEDDEENDEDDDDEGPTEAPIDEEPTIPSKVKSGEIPATVPLNKIVHITKLPKKCKQIDIVEAFAKFGAIDQIHLVTTPSGTVANVAFKTAKAAEAATAVSRKIKVIDSPVEVTLKKPRKDKKEEATTNSGKFDVKESRDRTAYVKYLKLHTTDDQVREHFAACGEIERCKVVSKSKITFAYVTFTDKESLKNALKLHNSVLNGGTIAVYECMNENIIQLGQRDPKVIIMLKNKQKLDVLEGAILEKIFSKCGHIEHMEVLCGKNILAFIVFDNEQAVEKALKLNGKTEEGIELEVERYDGLKKKPAIHVSNLHPDCTEEDLRKHFSESGEIKSIILRKGYAIIHFTESDGYCKSFLLDESYLKRQQIFIEPLSSRKQLLMKQRMAKILAASTYGNKGNRKRPFQNGNSVFKGKKPKLE